MLFGLSCAQHSRTISLLPFVVIRQNTPHQPHSIHPLSIELACIGKRLLALDKGTVHT